MDLRAIESLSRNLACEVGTHGVRVVNIRSAGSPDSKIFKEALDQGGDEITKRYDAKETSADE